MHVFYIGITQSLEMLREFQKNGPCTRYDVYAHHRAKNNRNCYNATAYRRALTSPMLKTPLTYNT